MPPFPIDPKIDTICDVVRRWVERQPNAPLFLEEGAAPLTYSALTALMDDIRCVLNASGLGRGDRIGVVHSGGADMMSILLGIMNGATAVPLNPNFSVGELAFHIRNSSITAMVVDKGVDTPVRSAAEERAAN